MAPLKPAGVPVPDHISEKKASQAHVEAETRFLHARLAPYAAQLKPCPAVDSIQCDLCGFWGGTKQAMAAHYRIHIKNDQAAQVLGPVPDEFQKKIHQRRQQQLQEQQLLPPPLQQQQGTLLQQQGAPAQQQGRIRLGRQAATGVPAVVRAAAAGGLDEYDCGDEDYMEEVQEQCSDEDGSTEDEDEGGGGSGPDGGGALLPPRGAPPGPPAARQAAPAPPATMQLEADIPTLINVIGSSQDTWVQPADAPDNAKPAVSKKAQEALQLQLSKCQCAVVPCPPPHNGWLRSIQDHLRREEPGFCRQYDVSDLSYYPPGGGVVSMTQDNHLLLAIAAFKGKPRVIIDAAPWGSSNAPRGPAAAAIAAAGGAAAGGAAAGAVRAGGVGKRRAAAAAYASSDTNGVVLPAAQIEEELQDTWENDSGVLVVEDPAFWNKYLPDVKYTTSNLKDLCGQAKDLVDMRPDLAEKRMWPALAVWVHAILYGGHRGPQCMKVPPPQANQLMREATKETTRRHRGLLEAELGGTSALREVTHAFTAAQESRREQRGEERVQRQDREDRQRTMDMQLLMMQQNQQTQQSQHTMMLMAALMPRQGQGYGGPGGYPGGWGGHGRKCVE